MISGRFRRAAVTAALALGAGLLPGACGRDRYIDSHVSCATGTCQCVGGFDDCDEDVENGCETDIQSDLAHCGFCGNACPSGATCAGGNCLCAGGGTPCSGVCVDTQTDTDNCGTCGNACTNGTCSGGACACSTGFADCDGDPSTGCETELTSDAENCGACKHGCAGGLCSAGVCQPVTIGGLDGANNIAVAGGYVYATRCNVAPDPALAQAPTGGGAVAGVGMVTGCPSLLAATKDAVYWAGALDQIVYSATVTDLATATQLATGTIPAYYVIAGPSHLYWYSDGPTEATIERLKLDTMALEALVVKTPSGFTADAAGVYWGDADGIHVWSVDSAMLYTDINPLVVRGLAVRGTVLFAITASEGIKALPVAPGGAVTAILPAAAALAIAVDDAHVYWAEKSDGSVRRANHDGTDVAVLTQGETFAGVSVPFALDDEAVYWVADGKVRKVAK